MNRSDILNAYAVFPMDLWMTCSIGTNILGAFGNLLTMTVLGVVKQFHSPNYLLLSGVSLCDFALNAFHFPFENFQSYYLMIHGRLIGNTAFCIWESPAYALFFTASNSGQMLVGCNRFLAVFTPLFYRKYVTNRAALLIWLIVSMAFPTIFYYGGVGTWFQYEMDTFIGDCREYVINMPSVIMSLCTIYIPLSITLFAYLCIFVRLLGAGPGVTRAEIMRRSRGSGAMCTCSVILLVSIFPQWIFYNTGEYDKKIYATMWIKFLFRFSYTVNPLFYFLFDSRLRRALIVLTKRYICRSQTNGNNIFSVEDEDDSSANNAIAPARPV